MTRPVGTILGRFKHAQTNVSWHIKAIHCAYYHLIQWWLQIIIAGWPLTLYEFTIGIESCQFSRTTYVFLRLVKLIIKAYNGNVERRINKDK